MDLNTPVLGDMNVVNLYIPKTVTFNGTSQTLISDALSGVSAGTAFHFYWEGFITSGAATDDVLINFCDSDYGGYCSLHVESGNLALYMQDNSSVDIVYANSGTTITNGYHAIHWFGNATETWVVMDGTTEINETFSSSTHNLDADEWTINGVFGGYGHLPCNFARCVFHEATLDGESSTVRARYQRTDNKGKRPSISAATDGDGEFDIWERETGDIAAGDGEQTGSNAFAWSTLVGA